MDNTPQPCAKCGEPNESLLRAFEQGFQLAHEPAECGHARANYKDPKFGTPEYHGEEQCEFCAALAAKK